MALAQLVSVDEYLHSTFEVDAEYLEGRILPRPMPQKDHSRLQTWLTRNLYDACRPLGLEIWVEQRIRTKESPPRFRVPDICLTHGEPAGQTFTTPPFLCIEILSPEDSAIELREKLREYLTFGVQWVWVIDPASHRGEIHSANMVTRVEGGVWQAGPLSIDLNSQAATRVSTSELP